ncbi:MAG: hypothetical protein QMD21_06515 [Candidatus Thermoplasmatota archaeon]|nr:hypothetical protein [Candidatus Thermoplasmatota archaeon]MDI6887226.1 hypothetical protein [Candidatus Thermoplasmatota archaeon]
MVEDWIILELEKAGIIKVNKANETKGEISSLVAEVAFTEDFISRLAWALTQYCSVHKSIDRFREIVAQTVREMLRKEGDVSKYVSLAFTILEASNIKQEVLEQKLMRAGYIAAK